MQKKGYATENTLKKMLRKFLEFFLLYCKIKEIRPIFTTKGLVALSKKMFKNRKFMRKFFIFYNELIFLR